MDEAPPPKRRRTRLGVCMTMGDRAQVYDTGDAIEIDTVEGYEIERRRVFYGDVVLITHGRRVNVFHAVVYGLGLAAFSIVTLGMWSAGNMTAVAWFGLACWLPLLLLLLLTLGRPQARVMVFGKRTKAQMRWTFRHARAEAVYAQLVARTQAVQEEDRRRIAARAPAAAPFAAPGAGADSAAVPAAAPPTPSPSAPAGAQRAGDERETL